MIFLSANELKLTDNVKCDIAKHRSELGAHLRRYFPEHKQLDSLSLPCPASSPLTDIEIATSGSVKIEFKSEATDRFLDRAALRVSCLGKSRC